MPNEVKHTPGPWIYDEHADFILAGSTRDRFVIAEVRGEGIGLPVEINGRLLAAAPELLDALKAIIDENDRQPFSYPEMPCFKEARAALKKAKEGGG